MSISSQEVANESKYIMCYFKHSPIKTHSCIIAIYQFCKNIFLFCFLHQVEQYFLQKLFSWRNHNLKSQNGRVDAWTIHSSQNCIRKWVFIIKSPKVLSKISFAIYHPFWKDRLHQNNYILHYQTRLNLFLICCLST